MKKYSKLFLAITLHILIIIILTQALQYEPREKQKVDPTTASAFREEDPHMKQNLVPKPASKVRLTVPLLCQYPILPTGCESTAAAMVLQYYGEDVSEETFARKWLECSQNFYQKSGKLYGPDPNEFFVGDPFSQYSYGCFAPPIEKAVNQNSKSCRAETIRNVSLEELCKKHIDYGEPILIWATMNMRERKNGNEWFFDDKTRFTWPAGEHCLVLIGYDQTHYYLNDPMSGDIAAYEKKLVEERYRELGSQAVLILPK